MALESWVRGVRDYETARLLVLSDLLTTAAMSASLARLEGRISDEQALTIRYPTEAWRLNGAQLATRLVRRDPVLYRELSTFFTLIAGFPPGDHLPRHPRSNWNGLNPRFVERRSEWLASPSSTALAMRSNGTRGAARPRPIQARSTVRDSSPDHATGRRHLQGFSASKPGCRYQGHQHLRRLGGQTMSEVEVLVLPEADPDHERAKTRPRRDPRTTRR